MTAPASRPVKLALLEGACTCGKCPALIVVAYSVRRVAADELNIQLVRVVPARPEGAVRLGEPITLNTQEKTEVLRQLGALEFELGAAEQTAEVSP